jgi:DNA-binding MarR family transcriptional regulator
MLTRRLLRAIADDPGHGPSLYMAQLGVTAGALQRAVDRLEELRFITRRPVPDRGTRVALRITDAGRKALAEAPG